MKIISQFRTYGVRTLQIITHSRSYTDSQFLAKNGYFSQILWLPNPINISFDTLDKLH